MLTIIAAGVWALALSPALGVQSIRFGATSFDWLDVEGDQANSRWEAEVISDTSRDFQVEVSVDLLGRVCRDIVVHTDNASVFVGSESSARVEKEDSLSFDRAADVESYRFRMDPASADIE